MYKASHLRDYKDYMCQEKEEEEDLSALKIVWMHQYKDLRITLKRAKID